MNWVISANLAEGRFIKVAVEPQANPSARQKNRQTEEEQFHGIDADYARGPESDGGHCEGGDTDWLEDCALF
jgi:hypothetical protein